MDCLKFRLRSFTVLQPIYFLHCGSTYELPIKYSSCEFSDFDILYYCYDICAIPWNRNPPKNAQCTILRIDSTEKPSGYARLKVDGDSTKDRPSYYRRPPMLNKVENGGPSIQKVRKHYRHYNTVCKRNKHNTGDKIADEVFAIYCPYWPVEAEEWRVRKRFHGWPNKKLIARITRGGCHFVSKLRTWSSCDDTEWRFSFSKAELLLVHSWTSFQKMVYYIIRVVKRKVLTCCTGDGNKGLQTYYFKTLMFWACEEFPPEFWREENLITCVETLLLRVIRCLEEKLCPSYFIPNCNIMCHLKDGGSFAQELQMLRKHIACGCARLAYDKITREIKGDTAKFVSFEQQCLLLMWSSFPINEGFNGRFSHYMLRCEWFLPGMKRLHTALEAHVRLMSLDNVPSRKESRDSLECLENFKFALIRNDEFEAYKHSDPDLTFYEILNASLIRKQSRNSIPIYSRGLRRNFEDDVYDQMVKESFPSPLFCAASAYRANFYLTAMQSYEETLTEFNKCLDIIHKAKSVIVNSNPQALISFIPVLICNSLSPIYDEHLQVILGFATLHRNISSFESPDRSTCHEVCLKLNAWEFLKYIYIQCQQKLSALPHMHAWMSYTNLNFFQPCMSQLTENSLYSAAILYAALRQSRVYTVPLRGNLIPRIISTRHNFQ